jgi:predicted phosphodiesterase
MKKICKSLLSAALALALLLSLALCPGAADKPLKIYVASDIHYRPYSALPPLSEANYLDDPLFHHVNSKSMLTYEGDAIVSAFLKAAEAAGAKYVFLAGDHSEDGHWAEHEGFVKILKAFQKRTGIQVFVVPGNHDVRTSARGRLDIGDFVRLYADFGYNQALTRREGDGSYTAELGGGYRLLAIDAVDYGKDASVITPELFDWIGAQLAQARKDGRKVIAMTHFNVLEHFMIEGFTAGVICIDQYRKLSTMLADAGVKYVFTGHEHANDISHAVTPKGNKIFDIETGSLTTYPNAYRQVTFSDASVKIKTGYVDRIDTSLLPKGFSKAQVDFMKRDFPGYSLGYHRAGFRGYANQIPRLTGTLADALKLPQGSAGYQAVEAAVGALADAAELPLYGEAGSVEAIANMAGVQLDRSGYASLLDLAGAIYGRHYAGNESTPIDSLEMRLLFQAINAVLAGALTEMPVRSANALLAAVGAPLPAIPAPGFALTLAAKGLYMGNPAKALAHEFVRMLGEGVFNDWSAPDDLNAELEPYGAQEDVPGRAVSTTALGFARDILGLLGRTGIGAARGWMPF